MKSSGRAIGRWTMWLVAALALCVWAPPARGDEGAAARRAAQPEPLEALHRPFEEMLDVYVRDGFVYYRALQLKRGRFDRYVASLDVAPAAYAAWSRNEQAAFWINAYNAFVLRTVIDRYPIRGSSDLYPPTSIRQISGAFDRRTHRAAGRAVTLDQIEHEILPGFGDPRVQCALGRGAMGSPRLRSEAYGGRRLEAQLADATREFVRGTTGHVRIDRGTGELTVSPVIGWHEAEFVKAYGQDTSAFGNRAPIERAILALIMPHLFPMERELIASNQFAIRYHEFDWRLNDLTGGRP